MLNRFVKPGTRFNFKFSRGDATSQRNGRCRQRLVYHTRQKCQARILFSLSIPTIRTCEAQEHDHHDVTNYTNWKQSCQGRPAIANAPIGHDRGTVTHWRQKIERVVRWTAGPIDRVQLVKSSLTRKTVVVDAVNYTTASDAVPADRGMPGQEVCPRLVRATISAPAVETWHIYCRGARPARQLCRVTW